MASVPQNQELDIGGLLKQAWEIFTRDPINWILLTFIGSLALGLGGFGGFQYAALKAIRGEKVEIGDAFYIFQRPGWILPIIAIIVAVVFVGTLSCGLGFLVAAFLLAWWIPLLVMFDGTPMDALKQSKDLSMANVGPTIMLMLTMSVIGFVAAVVPFGGLVASPVLIIFTMLALTSMYGGAGMAAAATPQQLDYSPNAPGFAPPAAAPPMGAPAAAPPMAAPPAAAPPMGAPAAAPPAAAPPMGAPAAAPPAAAPPMGAPAAAPPAAEPAVVHRSVTGPAAAPSAGPVETATQSTTNNPDEIVSGKTIAMSSVDFEQMLRDQQKKNDGE